MKPVAIFRHSPTEGPGYFATYLERHGLAWEMIAIDAGAPVPASANAYSGLAFMGGPMSVNDDSKLPWLTAEKRFIGDAVRAGKPFWGTCLGVQLLAASLGARVYPGRSQEIGLMPVELTEAAHEDPLFRDLPRDLQTFQWHGDTFDIPEGGVRLASSAVCPNQAFRWGRHAYGVQFHLEVSADLARSWGAVPEYKDGLERTLGHGALDGLVADLDRTGRSLNGVGRTLFERWLALTSE